MKFPRRSGILLHPTSLPGQFGIGVFSPALDERGNIRITDRLKDMFGGHGFGFESLPFENGALLYFKAVLR